jgi:hypothetical protein
MAIIQGVTRFLDQNSFNYDVAQDRAARGNYNFVTDGGAQGAFTIFAVTGTVLVKVFGVCSTLLNSAGAATIELGIAGNTAALIAQTTATDLDQYETWQDAVPEANPGDVTTAMAKNFVITNGADIIMTVATADLTAGVVDFYAVWYPLSTDGWVVGV